MAVLAPVVSRAETGDAGDAGHEFMSPRPCLHMRSRRDQGWQRLVSLSMDGGCSNPCHPCRNPALIAYPAVRFPDCAHSQTCPLGNLQPLRMPIRESKISLHRPEFQFPLRHEFCFGNWQGFLCSEFLRFPHFCHLSRLTSSVSCAAEPTAHLHNITVLSSHY
jgi:hypothetical protein